MYLLYFQIHFLRPVMYTYQIMWYGPGYIVLLRTIAVFDLDLDYTMSLSMYFIYDPPFSDPAPPAYRVSILGITKA